MRVVVLDGDAPLGREARDGVLRGEVLRVEVVGDDLGLEREQPREVREAVRERAVRRQVLEVAVVRRHVGAAAARERERVLELGADGEERPPARRRAAAAAPGRSRGRAGRSRLAPRDRRA